MQGNPTDEGCTGPTHGEHHDGPHLVEELSQQVDHPVPGPEDQWVPLEQLHSITLALATAAPWRSTSYSV